MYEVEERPPLDPPEPLWHAEIEAGPETFDDLIARYRGTAPDLAGHRVVHPGPTLATRTAAIIDADVRAALEAAIPLAPSHEPLALEGIDAMRSRYGDGTPNVAVFDAALGEDAPAFATTYAVPSEWRALYGERRYGFHGISQRDVNRSHRRSFRRECGAPHRLRAPRQRLLYFGRARAAHRRNDDGHDAARRTHDGLALGQLRSRGDLLSARPGHAACRVRAGTK